MSNTDVNVIIPVFGPILSLRIVFFSATTGFLTSFGLYGRGNGAATNGGHGLGQNLRQRVGQRLWLGHNVGGRLNGYLRNLHDTPKGIVRFFLL